MKTIATVLSACFAVALGKIVVSTIRLPLSGPTALAKFDFHAGFGRWSFKARLLSQLSQDATDIFPLALSVSPYEDWTDPSTCGSDGPGGTQRVTYIPLDGSWSLDVSGSISHPAHRARVFTAHNCADTIANETTVEYELTVLNTDYRHLSAERDGVLSLAAGLLGVLCFLGVKNGRYLLRSGAGMVKLAVACTCVSLVLMILSLWLSATSGVEHTSLNSLSLFADTGAKVLLSTVLIEAAGKRESYSVKSWKLLLGISSIYGVAAACENSVSELDYRFSVFETWLGCSRLIVAVGIYCLFLQSIWKSSGEAAQLLLLGSLYLLALPCIVCLSSFHPAALRAKVIFGGSEFADIAAQAVLTVLIPHASAQ